jgi:hypothetical protein
MDREALMTLDHARVMKGPRHKRGSSRRGRQYLPSVWDAHLAISTGHHQSQARLAFTATDWLRPVSQAAVHAHARVCDGIGVVSIDRLKLHKEFEASRRVTYD